MKTQSINSKSMTFKGKMAAPAKKAIKAFTKQYLKEKNGYVGTNASFDNAVAAVSRGAAGLLISEFVVENLPKLMQGDRQTLAITAFTGLGSLGVAWSRFKTDKIATATAKMKIKPFVEKMIEKGYKSEEELRCGVEDFMSRSGGFFTSKIKNKFSSKSVAKILNDAQSS